MANFKRWVTVAPAALIFFAGAPVMLASSAANAAEAAQSSAGVIEEILVTSRREAESLQDVPVAVTAFTGRDLERIAPRTLKDLDGLSPNVFIGQQTAGPSMGAIFIRGIGYADVEKTQAPQVGVIIDGIFQGTNTGQIIDMFDVDRVEINRGPQGVLYGKNTNGGTIVVERVKPQFNEWGWATSAQAGNYSEMLGKARVNIPLVQDQLALKLGVMGKLRDGYYDNNTRGSGKGIGDVNFTTYTAALRWQPTEAIDAIFTYDHIRDRSDLPPQNPRVYGDQPQETWANFPEHAFLTTDSYGLQAQWDLGFAVLSSITGYVDSNDKTRQDFDGATLNTVAVPLVQLHTLRDAKYQQFTQELRLSGDIVDNVSYTAGVYYYDTTMNHGQGTNQYLQLPGVAFGIPGVPPCAPFLAPNPDPLVGDALCQAGPLPSWQQTQEDVTSNAVFASVNWDVTDTIELSAGVRWLKDTKDFQGAFFTADAPTLIDPPLNANTTIADPGFPVKQNADWDDTITKFTATWRFTDNNSVYASYSEGFRSGGFSNRGNDPRFLSYDPEDATAYEIGSKNEFYDGRVRLNMAAFYTLLENTQFTSIITTNGRSPGTNTIINNADGDVDIYGFETDLTVAVTDNFSAIGTFGYLTNSSDKFSISSELVPYPANGAAGTACNPQDNPGNFPNAPALTPNTCPSLEVGGGELGRAPKYNTSITGVWEQNIGGNDLAISASYRWQDKWIIVGGTTSAAVIEEDAYSIIDARAMYQWNRADGEFIRFSLTGKNLGDTEFRDQALPLGANGGFQGWGFPRTYAFEVMWQR